MTEDKIFVSIKFSKKIDIKKSKSSFLTRLLGIFPYFYADFIKSSFSKLYFE